MQAVLELRGVSKAFGAFRAVDSVDLQLQPGELFSLVGPSGCGKTTTLRLIAGLETPDAGEIWLSGSRVDASPPYRRNVSTVFQSYALFPHLSVFENVAFGLRRRRESKIETRVGGVLEILQLQGKERRKPSELSGGERQRVALARSLVLQPDVLLLDEPLSALDPNLRVQVRRELRELQSRVGTNFLLVTHDQEEALSLSDRIGVMHAGKVEQVGTPREIYERPLTRFVAAFAGPVNWIGAVGVRPEHVWVGTQGIPATVIRANYLGDRTLLELRTASGEVIQSQVSAVSAHDPGDAVHLSWDPAHELRLP